MALRVRGVGDADDVPTSLYTFEIHRVVRLIRPRQLKGFRVERKTFDDVELIAVANRSVEHAGQEALGVDDQRVAIVELVCARVCRYSRVLRSTKGNLC